MVGTRFFFEAWALAPEDTDATRDIYVSIPNGPPGRDTVRPTGRSCGLRTGRSGPDHSPARPTPRAIPSRWRSPASPRTRRCLAGPDARALSGDAVQLLADPRQGADGRVYRIAFEAHRFGWGTCAGDGEGYRAEQPRPAGGRFGAAELRLVRRRPLAPDL